MKKDKNQAEDLGEELNDLVMEEQESIQEIDHPDHTAAEDHTDDDSVSPEEKIEEMQASLAEVTGKAEEYLDGWQRARAEFANYKKRILKENAEIRQVARGEVIKLYLDVLDEIGSIVVKSSKQLRMELESIREHKYN